MPRRLPPPDLARVFLQLDVEHRRTILDWEATLGLPRGRGWTAIPGLRDLLVAVAAAQLAAQMPGRASASDRLDRALRELGVDDDTTRSTRPADSLLRTIRNWHTAARQLAEEDFLSVADAIRSIDRGRTGSRRDE